MLHCKIHLATCSIFLVLFGLLIGGEASDACPGNDTWGPSLYKPLDAILAKAHAESELLRECRKQVEEYPQDKLAFEKAKKAYGNLENVFEQADGFKRELREALLRNFPTSKKGYQQYARKLKETFEEGQADWRAITDLATQGSIEAKTTTTTAEDRTTEDKKENRESIKDSLNQTLNLLRDSGYPVVLPALQEVLDHTDMLGIPRHEIEALDREDAGAFAGKVERLVAKNEKQRTFAPSEVTTFEEQDDLHSMDGGLYVGLEPPILFGKRFKNPHMIEQLKQILDGLAAHAEGLRNIHIPEPAREEVNVLLRQAGVADDVIAKLDDLSLDTLAYRAELLTIVAQN